MCAVMLLRQELKPARNPGLTRYRRVGQARRRGHQLAPSRAEDDLIFVSAWDLVDDLVRLQEAEDSGQVGLAQAELLLQVLLADALVAHPTQDLPHVVPIEQALRGLVREEIGRAHV